MVISLTLGSMVLVLGVMALLSLFRSGRQAGPAASRTGWRGRGGGAQIARGGGLALLGVGTAATALAWWRSLPDYSSVDPGMGPVANFLGKAIISIPVALLLLLGAAACLAGTIRMISGLWLLIASRSGKVRTLPAEAVPDGKARARKEPPPLKGPRRESGPER